MAVLLNGCGLISSREVLVPCSPQIVEYSADEQLRAGLELQVVEESRMVRRMMDDYGELRIRLRALRRCF